MTVAHGTVRRQRIHTPQPQGSPKACSSWRALSTRPHITGFTKGMFQLACPFDMSTYHRVHQRHVPVGVPFQHVHTSQGSPEACSSWRALSTRPHITGFTKGMFQLACPFNTSTHHRVHQRHVPVGVPFQHVHTSQGSPKACSSWRALSTCPHITGFTKGMFQLACPFNMSTHHRVHQRHVPVGVPFQHVHTSQGSPKACSSWRALSTCPHITGFTKGMFQLACPFDMSTHHRVHQRHVPVGVPFQHVHTSQGSPKACSSWRALSTRPHITGFAKGMFLSPLPHSTTFQSLVLLYKCKFCNGPSYIKGLFEFRQSVYNLRVNGSILSQPKFNLSWKKTVIFLQT